MELTTHSEDQCGPRNRSQGDEAKHSVQEDSFKRGGVSLPAVYRDHGKRDTGVFLPPHIQVYLKRKELSGARSCSSSSCARRRGKKVTRALQRANSVIQPPPDLEACVPDSICTPSMTDGVWHGIFLMDVGQTVVGCQCQEDLLDKYSTDLRTSTGLLTVGKTERDNTPLTPSINVSQQVFKSK
ncbi:hypothetical protein EYF80_053710 [Liparis tanakae]|uniref:Uncharacterized protein n=1 Tax=Liparis tanakae TaxID=230148 RepID=A0A4Z2F5V0_9TELE|nr:hypothetical protein EYF80_053710 [Liparis tanakae]